MTFHAIRIQHAEDTGRYHPAYYHLAPFPGTAETTAVRYKSGGHHAAGFSDLDAAQENAARLAAELDVTVPSDGFPVREMAEAGADVLLLDLWVSTP